jgi:hypothetical protein
MSCFFLCLSVHQYIHLFSVQAYVTRVERIGKIIDNIGKFMEISSHSSCILFGLEFVIFLNSFIVSWTSFIFIKDLH